MKKRMCSHPASVLHWIIFTLMALQFLSVGNVTANTLRPLTVAASILPQKYFIDKIAKGRIKTIIMVPPGANPHTYEPRPKQMVAISFARAYLAIGIEFEKVWLKKILSQNSHLQLFHVDRGIKEKRAGLVVVSISTRQSKLTNGHGMHQVSNPDPHIWLSPVLAKIIALNTAKALIAIDPENKEFYSRNLEMLEQEIDRLHQKIKKLLQNKRNRSFIVFHPAWGYFADAYGLKEVPIEVQGNEPSPKELQKIIAFARKKNIKVILVEPQFSDRSARIISKEIGAALVKVDPLAYDWADNLLNVARLIAKVSR